MGIYFFYLIYGGRLKQGEKLVCSIIMRSENATLKNSDNKNDSLSQLQEARVSRYQFFKVL